MPRLILEESRIHPAVRDKVASFVDGKTGLKVATSVDHQKVGKQACGVCLPGGDS